MPSVTSDHRQRVTGTEGSDQDSFGEPCSKCAEDNRNRDGDWETLLGVQHVGDEGSKHRHLALSEVDH
jgi:hypothetical protein